MLNHSYILQRIEPFLNSKRELSEFEFMELFTNGEHSLTRHEQYEVINLMIEHDIEYVDEKEEENKALAQLQLNTTYYDYESILHLSKLKNEQLCVMAKAGDKAALSALVETNRRFIYQKAIKLQGQFQNTAFTIDDFVQEGIIGMMEAVLRFDPNLDFSFLTYAWSWIRQKMERAVIDTGFLVRLPVHFYDKMVRINRYRKKNPDADIDTLINILSENGIDYSKDEVNQVILYSERYLNTNSLNSLVGDGEDTELIELLSQDDVFSIEEIVEIELLKDDLNIALSELTSKQADIIRMRFLSERKFTLEELGKKFNLTRERIRQIEVKALRKMRCKRLKEYLE